MKLDFITIIDIIGTFAFAISGIRLASAKKFDLFGAFVVGMATAVGGGTIRDLMLGTTPFWMLSPAPFYVTAFALLCVFAFEKQLVRVTNTIFIFDAIGLGLFVVVGVDRTLTEGFPMWVAIIMGTFTGAAGGVLRDIFINEVPLIFRRDIYAVACVMGGVVYYFCLRLGFVEELTQILSAVTVLLVRVVAVKFKISLPTLGSNLEGEECDEK